MVGGAAEEEDECRPERTEGGEEQGAEQGGFAEEAMAANELERGPHEIGPGDDVLRVTDRQLLPQDESQDEHGHTGDGVDGSPTGNLTDESAKSAREEDAKE